MKRTVETTLLTYVLLLGWAGGSSGQDMGTYVVRQSAVPCLNFRAEPNTSVTPEECLPPGTILTVIGTAPYWREVRLEDGREGWVAKKFVEPSPEPPTEPVPDPLPADAWLELHFVDVGQGDGIWIHTHDDGIDGNEIFEGRNIVIDGGPYSADSSNPMLPYMRQFGHHEAVIDALFVTHPHADHYMGAETLSRHFEIIDYYDPGFASSNTSYAALINALRGTDSEPGRARSLHIGRDSFGRLDWGDELTAEVLYSWPGDPTGLGSGSTRTNNSSIVLRLRYGDHSFLFMGDAEGKDREDNPNPPQYVEAFLTRDFTPAQLRSTVLKVGHHGSETSSTTDFIRAVDPDFVVVQSGRMPYSGHFLPNASTLRRYCCHDSTTRIYRTDQNDEADGLSGIGAADGDHIVIRTNGSEIQVEALEGGEPFSVTSCQPAC